MSFSSTREKLSTIDVVGNGFAVLTAGGGRRWVEAADDLAGEFALPLRAWLIDDGAFASAYELDSSGAVLVRPDGHVGWRSRSMTRDPSGALRDAVSMIMHTGN